MRQILFTIPMPWQAYAALLVLGVIALAVGGRLWRKQDADESPAIGNFMTVGMMAALFGAIGLFGVLPAAIPVFGYGAMLFLAFVGCTWLGIRLGRRVGIAPEVFKDLIMVLFIFGILGARVMHLVYFYIDYKRLPPPSQWLAVWDGGLVFYGSVFGGLVGFLIFDQVMQRKFPYDRWKLLDCVAPCVALGLALGRIGCLFNGCCYGDVACDNCPAIHFPLAAAPRFAMTDRGHQTTAGFTVRRDNPAVVDQVDPGSPAEAAGLKPGDLILAVNGEKVLRLDAEGFERSSAVHTAFTTHWPRSKNDLVLSVVSPGQVSRDLYLAPLSIGVFPTQIYETISMVLLLFFLISIFPYRPFDGSVMAIFMAGYGVHRFLNEMLRTDTPAVALGMTFSQNVSILVVVGAIVLAVAGWMRQRKGPESAAVAPPGQSETQVPPSPVPG